MSKIKKIISVRCANHEKLGYDDESCQNYKMLRKHEVIYSGLSREEKLQIYKKRVAMAFNMP